MCSVGKVFGQVDTSVSKSPSVNALRLDTIVLDSTVSGSKGIAVIASSFDLEDVFSYGSKDSSELDKTNEIVHLWGDAYVKYQTLSMNAHYLRLDLRNHTILAEVGVGPSGRPLGKPNVVIEGQQMVANKLKFNYKTKKGIIIDSRMKQTDLYINSKVTKVIAGPNDSIRSDDVVFQKSALITTCNYPEAHFGIRTSKAKFIPDKVGVIGPAYLEIEGAPLVLPFGLFPLSKGKQTGILFPNNYTFSPEWGYGLQNIGYYFPISDRMDLVLRGDIYLRGSHRVELLTHYNRRYKFQGDLDVEYSRLFTEANNSYKLNKVTTYRIAAGLNQSNKANPYFQFGGNINLQLGRHKELNFNDANSVLNNTMSSNISFSRIFPGKPFSLNGQISHYQNTQSRDFSITLPDINFQTQSIFPFKRKSKIGSDKWYEQISFNYSAKLSNKFYAKDTSVFSPQTLKSSKQGIDQNVSINSSYRVLKYFNITPSFTYNERWGLNTIDARFDPSLVYIYDTVINKETNEVLRIDSTVRYDGRIVKDTITRFHAFRSYSAGVNMTTQLYGQAQFRRGFIRAIRHQMKPSAGLNFTPDYRGYFNSIQTSNNPAIPFSYYSPYSENIFGGPANSGTQMGLSLGINNILEMKVRSRRDTIDRKVKIFDNLYVRTFYNFVADSFKLQPLSYGATTRLFKGLSVLNLNGQFDFYRSNNGRRVDEYVWKSSGKVLRFSGFSASLSTSLTIDAIRKWLRGSYPAPTQSKVTPEIGNGYFWDLFSSFGINHNINAAIMPREGVNKFEILTNSVNLTGSIPLTPKWKVSVGYIGYDFKLKQIVYPDLGFYRDLHCWEMGMNWQPVRGTYAFFIRVKPGSLDFLKVPKNKNRADALIEF